MCESDIHAGGGTFVLDAGGQQCRLPAYSLDSTLLPRVTLLSAEMDISVHVVLTSSEWAHASGPTPLRSHSMMCSLREEGDESEGLSGVLPPGELAALLAADHRPLFALQVLASVVARAQQAWVQQGQLHGQQGQGEQVQAGAAASVAWSPVGMQLAMDANLTALEVRWSWLERHGMHGSRAPCRDCSTAAPSVHMPCTDTPPMSTVPPVCSESFVQDALGTCERILRTPIPLGYTRHTSRFLMIWWVRS